MARSAPSGKESPYDDLRERITRVTREALELTRTLESMSRDVGGREASSLDVDQIDQLKSLLREFWRCEETAAELLSLPEEAQELLIAAGYIRQDEWADLYPRMKERQRLAKKERSAAFSQAKDLVLSGSRERGESLDYEGQDPEVFLENVKDFFEEVEFHYKSGSWRNTFPPDTLRNRSNKPKSLQDLKDSVSYSIPPPTRPRLEQKRYRRAERILFELEDAYTQGDLGQVFERLRRNDLVAPCVVYEDPLVAAEGIAMVGQVFTRLSLVPLATRVDLIWTETKISEGDDGTRVVHVDYALSRPPSEGSTEEEVAMAEARYAIPTEGRVSTISVQWIDPPPSQSFLDAYAKAMASPREDD